MSDQQHVQPDAAESIAAAIDGVARALHRLGLGDAATHLGALEAHAMQVGRVADALEGIARALDALEGIARALDALEDSLGRSRPSPWRSSTAAPSSRRTLRPDDDPAARAPRARPAGSSRNGGAWARRGQPRGASVKPRPLAPVPRVALTRQEAAAALGLSLTAFEDHVQPELRLIRRGSSGWCRCANWSGGSKVPRSAR